MISVRNTFQIIAKSLTIEFNNLNNIINLSFLLILGLCWYLRVVCDINIIPESTEDGEPYTCS